MPSSVLDAQRCVWRHDTDEDKTPVSVACSRWSACSHTALPHRLSAAMKLHTVPGAMGSRQNEGSQDASRWSGVRCAETWEQRRGLRAGRMRMG